MAPQRGRIRALMLCLILWAEETFQHRQRVRSRLHNAWAQHKPSLVLGFGFFDNGL